MPSYTNKILFSFWVFWNLGSQAEAKIRVVANIPPYQSMAQALGGEYVTVTSLASAYQDPHSFQPLPSQVKELLQSQLYLYSGLSFEVDLVNRLKTQAKALQVLDLNQGIPLLAGDSGDAPVGAPVEEVADVHTYLSPYIGILQAALVYSALAKLDPTHQEDFAKNYLNFVKRALALHDQLANALKPFQGETLYAFHGIEAYFAKEFGLQFESLEIDGKEVTPKKMQSMLEKLKRSKIKVIFNSEPVRDEKAENLAKQAGARLVKLNHYDQDWYNGIEKLGQALVPALENKP